MAKKEKNKAPDFNAPPRAPHKCHAYQLMDHAEAMLEEGDRLQASEKAWGAYIHQIKALAEEKGWPYRNTRDLPSVESLVDKLAHEKLGKEEDEVKYRAAVVNSLHKNFYGDVQPISQIRWNMEKTKELIDILRQLGGNGNDNGAPSGNGNDTPSGSGNDGEGGSPQLPQSSGHRNGTASMGKSHRTPQLSPHLRQAKKQKEKLKELLVEQPSVPLLTRNNFAFMSQAEFDALKDF